jgi:hypothetical protein
LPKNSSELTGKTCAAKTFSSSPGYSVASCIRTDFADGKNVPGPGAYDIVERPDVRKCVLSPIWGV